MTKLTEASAYELGRQGRLLGYPLANNSFTKMAWDNVVRNIGYRAAPKYHDWTHWEALWNKGWLDMNHDLSFERGDHD